MQHDLAYYREIGDFDMGTFEDIEGQRFGRLTVLPICERRKCGSGNELFCLCRCDCGKEVFKRVADLKRGRIKSCGCYKKEVFTRKGKGKYPTVHHGEQNRLYRIYNCMKNRCGDVNNHRYGGRGITVCDEWNTFEKFQEWALANGYEETLTIDRIDNNKGYSPENCRWVDERTQANNTSRNRTITYNGETRTVAEWARIKNVKYRAFYNRVRYGWSDEDTIATPVMYGKRNPHYYKGKEKK